MDAATIGQQVKQKYPQYQNMSDEEVGTRVLSKYPQYGQIPGVDMSTNQAGSSASPVSGGKFTIPSGVTLENVGQVGANFLPGGPLTRILGGAAARVIPKAIKYRTQQAKDEGILKTLLGGQPLPEEQRKELYGDAAVGAVTQATGEAAGAAIGKLIKPVARILKNAFGSKLNELAQFTSEGLTAQGLGIPERKVTADKAIQNIDPGYKTLVSRAEDKGLPNGSINEILKQGKAAANSAQTKIDEILTGSNKQFNVREILNGVKARIIKEAGEKGNKSVINPARESLDMIIKNNPEKVSAKEMYKLIDKLSTNKIYSKTASEISAGEQYAQRVAADELRKIFKKQIPEVAAPLTEQKFWAELTPYLLKKSGKGVSNQGLPQSIFGILNTLLLRPASSATGISAIKGGANLLGKAATGATKAAAGAAKVTAGQKTLEELVNRTSPYQGVPQGR